MNLPDRFDLEAELRQALWRQDPPEGFAERVIQQAGPARAQFQAPERRRRFRLLWPSVSVAAAAVLAVSGAVEYRHVQEERAGRQAIEALQILAEGLNLAQIEVLNQ